MSTNENTATEKQDEQVTWSYLELPGGGSIQRRGGGMQAYAYSEDWSTSEKILKKIWVKFPVRSESRNLCLAFRRSPQRLLHD